MSKDFKKYYETINYLESLGNIAQPDYMKAKQHQPLTLKRFEYFLKLIKNPEKKLKYIHITGTSGKGSVATMLQSILTQAGYKTGLFTSPFSTTSIEKIKVDDLLIAPEQLVKLVEKIKPAIEKSYQSSPYGRPSYFEIWTALAFLYFKQQKCDYIVLEVGMGGRYDSTNVIPAPVAAVINLVAHDHTALLGKTLEKIATEKAGIIKPKTTVFTTAKNKPNVLKLIKKVAKKNKALLHVIKKDSDEKYDLQLLGEHQQENASLVVAIARFLKIDNQDIIKGLKKVKMSCRAEIIKKNPLILLDGAHNKSKMSSTAKTIRDLTYKKLYLIIALTDGKNVSEIVKEIKPLANYVLVTRFEATHRKCCAPKKLADKFKDTKKTEIFLDQKAALKKALQLARKDDSIVVTGSFFLAGELRKHFRSELKILKERKI